MQINISRGASDFIRKPADNFAGYIGQPAKLNLQEQLQ